MLSKLHCAAALILLAPVVCSAKDEIPNYITHGPILGRLSSDGVGVWGRTARAGSFSVQYGTSPTSSTLQATRSKPASTGTIPAGSISRG